MANTKKIKEIDFEKELAAYKFYFGDGWVIHRRDQINKNHAHCGVWNHTLSYNYKKGTRYSNICKECLRSYSKEEIEALKHFLIVQKLKGR